REVRGAFTTAPSRSMVNRSKNRSNASTLVTRVFGPWRTVSSLIGAPPCFDGTPLMHQRQRVLGCRRAPPRRLQRMGCLAASAIVRTASVLRSIIGVPRPFVDRVADNCRPTQLMKPKKRKKGVRILEPVAILDRRKQLICV